MLSDVTFRELRLHEEERCTPERGKYNRRREDGTWDGPKGNDVHDTQCDDELNKPHGDFLSSYAAVPIL
jgi:hypothetical protein